MSQQDIINVLRKNKRPMSRGEIAKELGHDETLVSHSIKRMVKGRDIKTIELNRYQAMDWYHCKRRMKIYYV
jgi:hypothetical protein